MNGTATSTVKNRPRIPTPDREQRLTPIGSNSPVGVAFMAHHSYQTEVPVLGALVLSPIQELDGGSVNNSLHAGQPGTTALAQAVLSSGLGPVLKASNAPMTFTPVAVSQVVTSPPSPQSPTLTLTEISNTAPPSPPSSEADATERKDPGTPKSGKGAGKWGEVYV